MDNCPYEIPMLYDEALAEFRSFNLEDITDEEGRTAAVIVDTVAEDDGFVLPSEVVENLGGDAEEVLETEGADGEGAWDAAEEFAQKIADRLNEQLPQEMQSEGFSFYFGAGEAGGYYLFLSQDLDAAGGESGEEGGE